MMPARERFKTVLSGHIPDRVPFHPTIFTDHACLACGRRFEEAILNPGIGPEVMLGAALRYQTDGVRFLAGPELSWYEEKIVVEEDGRLVQRDRRSGKPEGIYDVAGGGKFMPFEGAEPMRTIGEVKAIRVPSADEYLQRGTLRDVQRCVKQAHDNGLFVVGM